MSGAASICPRYHYAVELIGRRWTGAIIRGLLSGRARYNELRATVPDISDRMLSERLRELEAEGVITRSVIPASPVRVEYELTAKGRALERAILAIGEWAEAWLSEEDLAGVAGTDAPRPRSAKPDPRGETATRRQNAGRGKRSKRRQRRSQRTSRQ
jgi:DNA-binding HxlR family transcriptional regulator